jgi:hypothetical protein
MTQTHFELAEGRHREGISRVAGTAPRCTSGHRSTCPERNYVPLPRVCTGIAPKGLLSPSHRRVISRSRMWIDGNVPPIPPPSSLGANGDGATVDVSS